MAPGGCQQRILIEDDARFTAYPMAIRYFLRFVSPFAEPSMSTSKGRALKRVDQYPAYWLAMYA